MKEKRCRRYCYILDLILGSTERESNIGKYRKYNNFHLAPRVSPCPPCPGGEVDEVTDQFSETDLREWGGSKRDGH
ncbi:hypothetical protein NPIL_402091 [Nephila pilipes]|uniref:Uncharacterized protein n=1 Tax=Nephila pilipes TaxID=299642 RepID=A0A8X6QCE8_NEPPI|nr:hypothetical protein NPIL_402091 [Nephila pilipes]